MNGVNVSQMLKSNCTEVDLNGEKLGEREAEEAVAAMLVRNASTLRKLELRCYSPPVTRQATLTGLHAGSVQMPDWRTGGIRMESEERRDGKCQ